MRPTHNPQTYNLATTLRALLYTTASTAVVYALTPPNIAPAAITASVGAAWTVSGLFTQRQHAKQLRTLRLHAEAIAKGDTGRRFTGLRQSPECAALTLSLDSAADALRNHTEAWRAAWNEANAVLRSMPGGVLALDTHQRVLNANAEAGRLLGIDAAAAAGRLLQETVRQPELNAYLASDQPEAEFQLQGARTRTVRAARQPLRNASDTAVGQVVVLQDVTKLRNLESLRKDFAANVSHELRTPVTTIKGYAETLLDVSQNDPAQARRFLETISRSADRLAAIIEDTLALASLDRFEETDKAHSEALPREHFSAVGLGAAATEAVAGDAAAKRITIRQNIPKDLKMVGMDRLIEQALVNLLSNAVRYSRENDEIELSAARGTLESGHPAVCFAVRDHGVGIDPKHFPRLFERFYRVDPARSREVGGTGLGLAIVKHVAAVHGGAVDVQSEPGKGSTFHLIVPAAPPAQTQRQNQGPLTQS